MIFNQRWGSNSLKCMIPSNPEWSWRVDMWLNPPVKLPLFDVLIKANLIIKNWIAA
jgi:hypothetical protein